MENVISLVKQAEVLGRDLKVYGTVENPLFLARDVAVWIDYDVSSVNKMLANVDDDEKARKIVPALGGTQESWLLTENGLHEVLMLSRKPVAKQLKKEVKRILREMHTTGRGTTNTRGADEAEYRLNVQKQENDAGQTMTTKEIAEQLGTRPNVITENAKKCLPNKIIENGKTTYWNKAEVTILLDFMKSNNNRTDLDLSNGLIGTSTDLTPALKIKKAMELMQEGYEEELAILRARNEEQERRLTEQKPKVEFADAVMGSEDTIDIGEVAKVLHIKGLGRNKLFEFLRGNGILMRGNVPYQEYVDRGYFRIVENKFVTPDGETRIALKTVAFQKGVDFIRRLTAGKARLMPGGDRA